MRRQVEGMFIDLSALAKGYGVDRATLKLRDLGIRSAMLEVGGEIRVIGGRGSRAWSLGIETPDGGAQDVQDVVPLRDGALATSGDYRQVILHEGKLRSHTIDPRTGRPVEHGLASVSVVADTCMRADALATGLMVLGDDVGHRLAEDKGWAAMFISRNDDGSFRERTTEAWNRRLAAEASADAD